MSSLLILEQSSQTHHHTDDYPARPGALPSLDLLHPETVLGLWTLQRNVLHAITLHTSYGEGRS